MPKTINANLEWRAKLLDDAANDEGYQRELYTAASISPLFWMNAFCIARGTRVVTDRGPVPIEDVSLEDRVWDGEQWVGHDGVLHSGSKSVMYGNGIWTTPEHKIWTEQGWRSASDRLGRAAVRLPDGYEVFTKNLRQAGEGVLDVPLRLWGREGCGGGGVASGQAEKLRPSWVQGGGREAGDAWHVQGFDVCPVDGHAAAVREPQLAVLPALRGARRQGVPSLAEVRELPGGRSEDGGGWARYEYRPDKQRWELHAVELPVGEREAAGGQPQGPQAEVCDLLNCGPRHAFTVLDDNDEPVLVSNCWTYRQKITDPATGRDRPVTGNEAHVPFVTWDIQDDAVTELERCMDIHARYDGGQDALIDKSRDMGATWIIVSVFHHAWLFVDNVNILWVSATASDVDMHPTTNPDTIFYKHDYINFWLPDWMRPPTHRRNMHIGNKLRGNSLDGEATTANVGRGGRRTVIGFDEFAAVEDGDGMLSASSDTTSCRIFNSTPKGPGTSFTRIRNASLAGDKVVKYICLPWWEHPEKGRGRSLKIDHEGNKKYTSPWYEWECKRRSSPQEIAQNLDMDHLDSGSRFFDGSVIARHKSTYRQKPLFEARLDFDKRYRPDEIEEFLTRKDLKPIRCNKTVQHRPWKFWMHLVNGRPDQSFNYVIGIDIANGQGASNSVMAVRCVETGEKVAEFCDANTPPHDLARLAAVAGMWFGGASANGWAKLVWESNGPGGIFGREVWRLGYPNILLEKSEGTTDERTGNRYGWHSSRDKKATLLGLYRRQLARDEYINHSAAALEECEEYIYYEGGSIGPARLLNENETARATHGDRVIADALTCLGAEGVHTSKPKRVDPPYRSFHQRQQRRKAALKAKRNRWRA